MRTRTRPGFVGDLGWSFRSQLAKQEYLTPNEKFFVRNHLPVPTGMGSTLVDSEIAGILWIYNDH